MILWVVLGDRTCIDNVCVNVEGEENRFDEYNGEKGQEMNNTFLYGIEIGGTLLSA